MNQSQFREFISELHNSYGKRAPGEEIMEFLWRKVGELPSKAVPWMIDRFLSMNQIWPVKLHPAIMACWYDWRNAHPDKAASNRTVPTNCRNPNCVDGILFLVKPSDLYQANAVYTSNCGDCKRITDQPHIETISMFEAHQRGYNPLDLEAKPEKSPQGLSENWRGMEAYDE